MWPMYVDYSDEECKRVLRSLELEAYASIISAFRAQGNLTKDRKKMLYDLCSALSISMERHRAEIRRAVNDEHLSTVSERLFGPNNATEWAIEGRRVVPLMQRLAPQTVFTDIANSAASAQAAKNAALPQPGKTGLREISNGIETMASRKRKELASDYSSTSPHKMPAMDSQFLNNVFPFDDANSVLESSQIPEVSMSSESFPVTEVISASFTNFNAPRVTTPLITATATIPSPSKSTSKLSMQKPSSTITTFSSFDPMTSNLLSSRCPPQSSLSATSCDEISIIAETTKLPSGDMKTSQRSLSSMGSMKSSTIVIPTSLSSTSSASSTKELLPSPSTASSSSNKFLTQIRSKNPTQTRQNLPAGLGMKLNPQSHMTQRATVAPKSPGMKMKQDSTTSLFPKKTPPSVFPLTPTTLDSATSQFPSSSSSESITKSPVSVSKLSPKTTETQPSLSQQVNTKPTAVTKTLPKTTAHSSQYISKSLFSTANKSGGAKNLSPVIFNVSSSCGPLHTSTKSTVPVQSEAGKGTPQLLPKSATAVGINPNQIKITSSNSQAIQYRNDGALVRSARIVNISQPVGSRLPCAISPSAISALGLTTNISSTALRVTLPPGTLSTNSSIRVSAAAKPNVIVVHKAQMWPKAQQGAAVIMSSTSNLSKQEAQKQDKSKSVGNKPVPRPIAPARPQSPAVSSPSVKVMEVKSVQSSPPIAASSQPNSSTTPEAQNSKSTESNNEAQCKKNLLADIIEASGILTDNSPERSSKDKSESAKKTQDLSNHQETELKNSQKSSVSSTSSEAIPVRLQEANTARVETTTLDAALSISQGDRNGMDVQIIEILQGQALEVSTKETDSTTVSSTHGSTEVISSSSESGSKVQKEISADESL